ncbi:MAG: hypothetical protein QCI00_08715, partial [Candidatus Thermoplasmatota archaeon]|nr:hypothetical protein [Candidatus Thermoplasmatota archaeon]
MKEVLATSPVVVTKLTTDFNSIQYSFLKIKTLHGFEKILEEILFDVIRCHPKEISLDLRNVIQLDDKLDYL